MSALVRPILSVDIFGHALRFFRGPEEGEPSPSVRPQHPWHSVDDLFAVCGFSTTERSGLLRTARVGCGHLLRTTATPDGPVTIAPHAVARVLFDTSGELGIDLRDARAAYMAAALKAIDVLVAHMSESERFAYVLMSADGSEVRK